MGIFISEIKILLRLIYRSANILKLYFDHQTFKKYLILNIFHDPTHFKTALVYRKKKVKDHSSYFRHIL